MTFDRPLQPGPVAHANWNARHTNERYAGAAVATVAGANVTVPMAVQFANFGADVVTYNAAPADVISTHGVPAAGFVDFPIT